MGIYDSEEDCITSQFVMKLHPKQNTDTLFVNYFMHSFYFQFCVEKYKKGKGNMTNIFVSQLLNFPIYYPDAQTRSEIVKGISKALNNRNDTIKQITVLRNKIDSLLDNILTKEI